jgi:hypothetical protein
MTNVSARISCSSCHTLLDVSGESAGTRSPCPSCGSTTRTIGLDIALVAPPAHIRLSAKAKAKGAKKAKWELKKGPTPSVRLQKLVDHTRLIDRENDQYSELVLDRESGEIIHSRHEPLSNHKGHGSAKRK